MNSAIEQAQEQFAQVLRGLVDEKKYTVGELAEAFGVGEASINNWKGRDPIKWVGYTSLENRIKILDKLVEDRMEWKAQVSGEIVEVVTTYDDPIQQSIMLLTDERQLVLNELEKLREKYETLKAKDNKLSTAIEALRELRQEN